MGFDMGTTCCFPEVLERDPSTTLGPAPEVADPADIGLRTIVRLGRGSKLRFKQRWSGIPSRGSADGKGSKNWHGTYAAP